MAAELPLPDDVAAIAAKVRHDPETHQFGLSDEDFAGFAAVMAKPRGAAETDELAEHLVALCLKYERLAADHTKTAISQFMVLLALALGDARKTEGALDQAGVEVSSEVRSLIASESSKLPLAGRTGDGVTPFDLQLKQGTEPKD